MNYKEIILEKREDGIIVLTLNRPKRMNALTHEMFAELLCAFEEIKNDETARVLITTGAGERAFQAGADFKADDEKLDIPWERRPTVFYPVYREVVAKTAMAFMNFPIPTIAMVNGVAVGGGFDIACGHDIRIGSTNARFMVAWMRRALMPAMGATWFLPRIVGLGKALEIILSARFVEAEEAERIGLLNKLVPPDKLEEETMEFARRLAKGAPFAQRIAKYNVYRGLDLDLPTALDIVGPTQYMALGSEDFVESVKAFQEKREPVYKGK
jgi:2-(1,2-epoxy-1,2-dihydrophenyl)acetyl-CoA isomerase